MSASWTRDRWDALDRRVSSRTLALPSDAAMREIGGAARGILRAFSSSFFLVTRFLPASKRANVDIIYAAVRYPDEIVDTFPLPANAKRDSLDRWQRQYETALELPDVPARLAARVPWILAGFTEVVQRAGIPPQHYREFLAAMGRDVEPRPFHTLDDLIANYVYGSAVVVGYFLAHVYGTEGGAPMADAYRSARDLGIALQLTNFARDVFEDRRRGRLYIPTEIVEDRGMRGGIAYLSEHAEQHYERAAATLDVFAADTRPAIRACIDVYRMLNRRILQARDTGQVRHSVPMSQKLAALPADKYWRVPLAYLGGL